MSVLRLDKYLCDMQIGSRAEVKGLIKKKRIKVNEETVTKPELKIDTDNDIIKFDDEVINYQEYEYFMLNKPQGVISATNDKSDKTVIDLIKDAKRKDLFPVGRLDKDTEGLLLITNDGELSHNLLSPKRHVDKTYFAKVKGHITDEEVLKFKNGLVVDETFTAKPARLHVLKFNDADNTTDIQITIHEGKFHQIKRMFEAVGSEVLYLKRLSMGTLLLDKNLIPGEYRKLSQEEINALKGVNND
ncbi:MAG: rRNA pseudouridine synthase [Lachnospira sp.]|nr:rRNA pseudouridine synthase [Lachnospira sp.]